VSVTSCRCREATGVPEGGDVEQPEQPELDHENLPTEKKISEINHENQYAAVFLPTTT
jgi:hypothetical protein